MKSGSKNLMLDKFGFSLDAQNSRWVRPGSLQTGLFGDSFGEQHVWGESERKGRLRVFPTLAQCNILGSLHGGFTLALIDHALFLCPAAVGIAGVVGGVTIDVAAQFFGVLKPDVPVDVVVEVLKETGGMVFSRGVVEQNGLACVAFSGTTKKARI